MHKTSAPHFAFALIVVVIAGIFYHHPSKRLLGQTDVSSYLFSGLAFARGEGFGPRKTILNDLPSAVRDCVVKMNLPLGLRDTSPTFQQKPFYLEWQVSEQSPADLVPRFPPGFPVALAAGYKLAGWKGALAVNGVIMVLAGVLVTYLAGRVAGPLAGVFAAGLWAVFPLNLWIANTTLAEPLVLLLGLTAVFSWVRSRESQSLGWPIVMGVCVGLAPVVKLDAIPWAMLPLGYAWENRHRGIVRAGTPIWAAVPCLLFSGAVLLSAQSAYATESLAGLIRQPVIWWGIGLGVVALILTVVLIRRWRLFEKTDRAANPSEPSTLKGLWASPRLKPMIYAAIVAGFGFFFFVRPWWAGADQIYWAPWGKIAPSFRELSLLRISWYFPVLGLWTAMLSLTAAALWGRETWIRLTASIGVAVLLFLSYDCINFPIQPFATRRFLPQVLPLLLIALAGAGEWWRLKPKMARWGSVGMGLLAVYTIAVGIYLDTRMNSRADGDGLLDKVRALADMIGPNGIVVLRQSSPFIEIAPLLAFGFERDVLPLRIRDRQEMESVAKYLKEKENTGRTIWVWSTNANDRLGLPGWLQGDAVQKEITVPLLHMNTHDRPFSWDDRTWKFTLRKLSLATVPAQPVQNANRP